MVFEDLQEVVCQLEVVWVLEATSSVLNGSVEEFPQQMVLNVAHVESGFEEGIGGPVWECLTCVEQGRPLHVQSDRSILWHHWT